MTQPAPAEILALARLLGELDYYQLLHLDRTAQARDVKRAYHMSSRAYHPDANRRREPELRAAVAQISKRIAEAYSVLRDPRRRQAYDEQLQTGSGVRIQLGEAKAAANRKAVSEREGATPQGRQYYKLATIDIQRQNWSSAARNLQTALTFEPGNARFKEQLADVKSKL